MSKNSSMLSEENLPSCSWGYGYVCRENTPDFIIGKILTLIDAIGLQDKQDKALKDIIRQTIREVFFDEIWISSERHSEIRNGYLKWKEERGNTLPAGGY
jgi:hypothetical protein